MPPAFAWFLALRYLLSRWVNLIGMLGVALAVWALIVVIAVFSGFISDTRRGIREASPDLLVTELPYKADFVPIAAELRKDPDVRCLAPRLSHDGILFPIGGSQRAQSTDAIANSSTTNYVLLMGIDAAAEAATVGMREWLKIVRDNYPEDAVDDLDDPFSITPERVREGLALSRIRTSGTPILGKQEGVLLGLQRLVVGDPLHVGQRVDIVTARFRPEGEEFELEKVKINTYHAGAYSTDHRFYDIGTCLIDINTLRTALGENPFTEREWVNGIAIKLRDGADRRAVRSRVTKVIDTFGGGKVLTWEEQNKTYLGAVDRERTLMKIVLFAVLVVAGFLIFATLHMMVVQKTKDIGILTSLGATRSSIGAVFVLSSLAVGTAGCVLGMATGFLTATFLNDIFSWLGMDLFPRTLYAIKRIPIDVEAGWMVQVALGALFLSLVVAWLPARRAAQLDPVKALMHE